jgi:hypothetical protein
MTSDDFLKDRAKRRARARFDPFAQLLATAGEQRVAEGWSEEKVQREIEAALVALWDDVQATRGEAVDDLIVEAVREAVAAHREALRRRPS